MQRNLKALLFSDLHCSIKQLVKMNEFLGDDEGKDIALLLFCGDAVNQGEPVWVVEDLIRFLEKASLPFFWVPGNNDFGRAYHKLNAKYPSLEGKIIQAFGHTFAGVGGSPASWSGQYTGENMIDKKAIANSIFLSHVPPPGVFNWQKKDLPAQSLTSKDNSSGNRKESSGLPKRHFADAPFVHICGHVHHQWGCSYLGQTKLIKLASLETGHYAIMDLESLSVKFKRF